MIKQSFPSRTNLNSLFNGHMVSKSSSEGFSTHDGSSTTGNSDTLIPSIDDLKSSPQFPTVNIMNSINSSQLNSFGLSNNDIVKLHKYEIRTEKSTQTSLTLADDTTRINSDGLNDNTSDKVDKVHSRLSSLSAPIDPILNYREHSYRSLTGTTTTINHQGITTTITTTATIIPPVPTPSNRNDTNENENESILQPSKLVPSHHINSEPIPNSNSNSDSSAKNILKQAPKSASFSVNIPRHSTDAIVTIGRNSAITATTADSSGMDRRAYHEANTIKIPDAYHQTELAKTSGTDRHIESQPRLRFHKTNSFGLKDQRRKSKMKADDHYIIPGKHIEEGHHNYIMAYNMITGIRVAVSRCSKVPNPLTDTDYSQVSKLIFDMGGNTMTPSTKYEFKFKDYSPEVFRHLRHLFKVDQADYLLSLTERVCLTELGSPGKSGSFFYYSRDYKFIIKTIHHSEHRQLRKVLKKYYEYVKTNPNTFISQFYGLHRLKMHTKTGITKIHFLVMNNIFPPNKEIHECFDLKGSTNGRRTDISKAKRTGKSYCMKDLNFLENKEEIRLSPEKSEQLLNQLNKDVALLEELNIMDYSLLLGIHDIKKATAADPENRLSAFDHPVFPEKEPDREQKKILDSDGGIRAVDSNGEPMDIVYYMGVIDCLTNYSTFKRLETFFRSLKHKRESISAVPPEEYGGRFLKFISNAIKTPDFKTGSHKKK